MMPKAAPPPSSSRGHAVPRSAESTARPRHPNAGVFLRERLSNQSQTELKVSVVPVLTQALREATDSRQRQRLARALGQLGPAARDSVPVLIDCCLNAPETTERVALLSALGRIGPGARQAAPILIDSLRSDRLEVRQCAAQSLLQLGSAARSCCREYAKHNGDDALVREVMARINGPEGRIGIDDECDCFSVKTIRQTQGEIRRLATTASIEILIETTSNKIAGAAKDKSDDRKRQLGLNGVHLSINKDVPNVRIQMADALLKRGLTEASIRQVLQPHLRENDYDNGLRAVIHFLARFQKEQPEPSRDR